MSDWNEELVEAKAKKRGIIEQRGNIHSKKKKGAPGRYALHQRVNPDSSLAKMMKSNPWAHHRNMTWADIEEAKRVGGIFARKNSHYEYRILDTVDDVIYPLKGQ